MPPAHALAVLVSLTSGEETASALIATLGCKEEAGEQEAEGSVQLPLICWSKTQALQVP